jgi:hypothetical protein
MDGQSRTSTRGVNECCYAVAGFVSSRVFLVLILVEYCMHHLEDGMGMHISMLLRYVDQM